MLPIRSQYTPYLTGKPNGLWVMGLVWVMPANQVGKAKKVWFTREYGLIGVWVKRESSVQYKQWALIEAYNKVETLACNDSYRPRAAF
jgi:hypothetical protein